MKKVWAKDTCKSLRSLGIYSICAGSWILTDSKIFLLIAQKTGMIEQIPFLCFFFLPVALLEFTKKIMPQKEQMLFILQNLFLMMECRYVVNYIGQVVPVTILIVAEHLLMAVAIILILYGGFMELRQRKDKKLIRVLISYIIFSVFSVRAFVFFYKNHSYGYSLCYVTGILGFIICLGDEFVISLFDKTCAEVKAYVQALQREIDRADRPCDIEISAAIGYAWTDDREKKLDEADKAMYEKKEKMKQKR